MEQGSQEWLEWRRKGIGASDIAAILGVSPYSTPYQIWREKIGRSTGFAGNFATQRGTELEAKARARYELVSLEDMPPALAIHPKYDILRVSLDGRSADGRRILEIKCPGRESHASARAGRVPDHYIPQVQFQLAVTGADSCDYFSFFEDEHAIVEVISDVEYQGELVAKALDFWELVKAGTPPPLTDQDDKVIDAGEVFEICRELENKKDKLKKSDLEKMKERVISLGGHSRVRCGRVLVTRSRSASGKDSYRLTISKGATNG
jgi:putative phage-type endonuclease